MATTYTLTVLAVDIPTASVVAALLTASAALAARMAPKTRTEAGVDRSTAHLNDVKAWSELVGRLEALAGALESRVGALEAQLTEERDDCDRKIADLQAELREFREQLGRQ